MSMVNKMEIKDTLLYKILKPIAYILIRVGYPPKVIGLENIPKTGRVILAGNHTKQLDPILLMGMQKRVIHFLAKDELFHSKVKWIIKNVGCIPVNRRIHDKNALKGAINALEKDLCVGIFPEGTINRTDDIIMPFKIGAVKAASETNSVIVPFTITGEYKLFKKGPKLEFLKPIKVGKDLDKENEKLMNCIKNNLKKEGFKNVRKNDSI